MMTIKSFIRMMLLLVGIISAGLLGEFFSTKDFVISEAEAVVGRPLTPGSYAGVARRTSRRVIRRSTIYYPALPSTGCTTVVIEGTTLYQCGTTYYQPYQDQYVVVYVD